MAGPHVIDVDPAELEAWVRAVREQLERAGQRVSSDGAVRPAVAAEILGAQECTLKKWRNRTGAHRGPDFDRRCGIWYPLEALGRYVLLSRQRR